MFRSVTVDQDTVADFAVLIEKVISIDPGIGLSFLVEHWNTDPARLYAIEAALIFVVGSDRLNDELTLEENEAASAADIDVRLLADLIPSPVEVLHVDMEIVT